MNSQKETVRILSAMIIDVQSTVLHIKDVTDEEVEKIIADIIKVSGWNKNKVIKFLKD